MTTPEAAAALDALLLELLHERPGRPVSALAEHPRVKEALEKAENLLDEPPNLFYRVRASLRRLRVRGLAYCAKGLHGWYPVGVIPRAPLDKGTQTALAKVRAFRRTRRARQQPKIKGESATVAGLACHATHLAIPHVACPFCSHVGPPEPVCPRCGQAPDHE